MRELPIDIVKIDKKFVDLVGTDQVATAIVQMIAKLASDLGKTTVAEGIETEAQRRKLLQCAVDQGQGYLVSPPLSLHDFMTYIEGQRAPDLEYLADKIGRRPAFHGLADRPARPRLGIGRPLTSKWLASSRPHPM